MTERREKRNEQIKAMFDELRGKGLKVDDALEPIAENYALEPGTVRKIIYDKNYCRRRDTRKRIISDNG